LSSNLYNVAPTLSEAKIKLYHGYQKPLNVEQIAT